MTVVESKDYAYAKGRGCEAFANERGAYARSKDGTAMSAWSGKYSSSRRWGKRGCDRNMDHSAGGLGWDSVMFALIALSLSKLWWFEPTVRTNNQEADVLRAKFWVSKSLAHGRRLWCMISCFPKWHLTTSSSAAFWWSRHEVHTQTELSTLRPPNRYFGSRNKNLVLKSCYIVVWQFVHLILACALVRRI